ncbi:hypothetical protein ACFWZ4_06470 [Frateuria sp. GZRe12]|uniref:hypothetical protein n=1 Tax=Frateuria sp. GZRe12 TaxID=3351533 RepID=UPI003EDBAFD2
MHLELPKARLESLKDFLKHYLMIVLSILTALGLEAWIEHTHHAHAAETARAQIEAEIRANLAEVTSSLAQDERQARALAKIRNALVEDFKASAPDDAVARHVQSLVALEGFNLNLRWPSLRQEAWDVAVANQSVSWIDDDHMHRYAAAYAGQRDMVTTLSANLALVMNGPRMVDAMTDMRIGNVQPREFLHVIGQMTLMLDQAKNNLGTLQDRLQAALAETKAP